MRKLVALVALLSLAACRYDAAFVEVTVVGTAPSVQQLSCTVTSSVSGSAKVDVPGMAAGTLTLPQSFTLKLPTSARAQVTVDVSAGPVSGSATIAIDGVGVYHTTVTLGGAVVEDMGTSSDAAPPLDAGVLPTGYTYARDFTIHRSTVGVANGPSVLNDYPVPIAVTDASLRSVANGGHVAQANGRDITFVATGATCNGGATCVLPSEIVHYDAAKGAVAAWVRVPQLATSTSTDADTVVTMLYGNPNVAAPVVDPSTTWDTGFRAVWHLASANTDSTTGGHDASSATYSGLANGALFGGAESFDGTAGYVQFPYSAQLDAAGNDLTVSTWMRTTVTGQQSTLVGNAKAFGYFPVGYSINLDLTTPTNTWTGTVGSDHGSGSTSGAGNVGDGAWHMLAFVLQGTSILGYEDGRLVSTSASTAGDATVNTSVYIAASDAYDATDTKPYAFFAGDEEEVRISGLARSAAWMATDHALLTTPGAIAAGAERAP